MLSAPVSVATLAEIFGFAGVIAGSSWGLLKQRRAILCVQATATACFLLHYACLGAWSGAGMCALTLAQTLASIPARRTRLSAALFWATVPLMAVLSLLTWNGIATAGAAFGMAMATLGSWQTETVKLRGFFMLC